MIIALLDNMMYFMNPPLNIGKKTNLSFGIPKGG